MINLRKHVSIFSGDQIMPDIEEYFSVAEAAKKLDFTVQGVAKLIRQGKLEGKKVGNMWLVSKASHRLPVVAIQNDVDFWRVNTSATPVWSGDRRSWQLSHIGSRVGSYAQIYHG